MHSILCTRVLLHIRTHMQQPDDPVSRTGASLSFEAPHRRRTQTGTDGQLESGTGTYDSSNCASGSGSSSSGAARARDATVFGTFQSHSFVGRLREDDSDSEKYARDVVPRLTGSDGDEDSTVDSPHSSREGKTRTKLHSMESYELDSVVDSVDRAGQRKRP